MSQWEEHYDVMWDYRYITTNPIDRPVMSKLFGRDEDGMIYIAIGLEPPRRFRAMGREQKLPRVTEGHHLPKSWILA